MDSPCQGLSVVSSDGASGVPPCRAPDQPQPTCGSGRGGETPKPTGTHPYWFTTAWLSPNGVFGLRNRRVELGRGRTKRTVGGTGRCLVPTPECEDQYKVTPRNDSASARPTDRFRMGCVCADFTTSLVETGEQQEKWQLFGEYLYSFFHRLVDVLCLLFMVS